MSRGGRVESREPGAEARDARHEDRIGPSAQCVSVRMDRMVLPRGDDRRPVVLQGRTFRLRESESRALVTVGTFRMVRADDLQPMRSSRDTWSGDLRSLLDQGLIETRTVDINHQSTAVVALTRDGLALLEAHRTPVADERPVQSFHAGFVKPRETAHDAQLYRLYQVEAARIAADGGRIHRVVLDYELKREYQAFLNRTDRPPDASVASDREAFAAVHGLTTVRGRLELPDLRLEYEAADGRAAVRDLELVTEHYSRGQLAGKAQAGFTCYQAAGARRGRGSSATTGGTPFDPHHLVRLT